MKKKEAAPAPPPAAVSDDKIDEAVRRAMVTHQAQTPPPARTPDPEPALPDDISADEKDELELYKFVESKDPAKKGLHAKALKFVADNKKFLEKRLEEEGDDYDPAKDPQYKKFLDANEPKLSQTEKRRFMIQRETDGLKQEAYEKARSELLPEIRFFARWCPQRIAVQVNAQWVTRAVDAPAIIEARPVLFLVPLLLCAHAYPLLAGFAPQQQAED